MTESEFISTFQITDIAEINSLSLFDYEDSLNNYFNKDSNPNFYQRYFKWFNYSKFDKTNNSHLKDFEEWFHDLF